MQAAEDMLANSFAPGVSVDQTPLPYFPSNLVVMSLALDTDMTV